LRSEARKHLAEEVRHFLVTLLVHLLT
jgi:hypothetical protein